jgi:hypothetical protein
MTGAAADTVVAARNDLLLNAIFFLLDKTPGRGRPEG